MSFVAVAIAGSAIAGLGGAAIAAHGAGKAANAQVNAANQAANLQHLDANAALGENRRQFDITQANLAPWMKTGTSALANYANLLGIPSGPSGAPSGAAPGAYGGPRQTATYDPNAQPDFSKYSGMDFNTLINSGDPNVSPNQQTTDAWTSGGTPFHNITSSDGRSVAIRDPQAQPQSADLSKLVNPDLGTFGSMAKFQAPQLNETTDPGFQARLKMGTDALEKSAAARGGLLTGGTLRDLNQFSQDYASNEYGQVYNRAFNQYSDQLNRLAALSGVGQTTATNLGTLGQNSANNIGNILMTSGQQIGNNINNAGAARASGYVGGANAWSGALGNMGNLALLAALTRQGGGDLTGGMSPDALAYPGPWNPPSGMIGGV